MLRGLVPLALFLVLAGFLYVGLDLNPREVPSPFIGKNAPSFSVTDLHDPDKVFDQNTFNGEVALFNVWASWCASCKYEHPILVDLSRKGLVPIYGLNYKDERAVALQVLNRTGNPYVASAFDEDGRVGIDWGVYGVPETFVIDHTGKVRHKHTGPISVNDLRDTILPLVRELQAEQRAAG